MRHAYRARTYVRPRAARATVLPVGAAVAIDPSSACGTSASCRRTRGVELTVAGREAEMAEVPSPTDVLQFCREANEVAKAAVSAGNHLFGAGCIRDRETSCAKATSL